MQLHCLGTAGYHPSDQRHTSCYVVPAAGCVLDAGTGIFRLPGLLETDHLDILLSHAHLDHVVGLTYLLDVLQQRPVEQVTVWGARSKLAAIREHLFDPAIFPVMPRVDWRAIEEEEPARQDGAVGGCFTLTSGGGVRWFPLEHPGGAVGYRIQWPARGDALHTLAYVTDTTAGPDAPYLSAIAEVDLLLHECNFRDENAEWAVKTGHSCTSATARLARQARVGRLLMTHMNPLETGDDPVGIDTARAIFAASDVARDGQVVEF
jgi:ribonuclease Z